MKIPYVENIRPFKSLSSRLPTRDEICCFDWVGCASVKPPDVIISYRGKTSELYTAINIKLGGMINIGEDSEILQGVERLAGARGIDPLTFFASAANQKSKLSIFIRNGSMVDISFIGGHIVIESVVSPKQPNHSIMISETAVCDSPPTIQFLAIGKPTEVNHTHWVYFTPVFCGYYTVTGIGSQTEQEIEQCFFEKYPSLQYASEHWSVGFIPLSEYLKYQS